MLIHSTACVCSRVGCMGVSRPALMLKVLGQLYSGFTAVHLFSVRAPSLSKCNMLHEALC